MGPIASHPRSRKPDDGLHVLRPGNSLSSRPYPWGSAWSASEAMPVGAGSRREERGTEEGREGGWKLKEIYSLTGGPHM
jgi:hypothetical protein